MQRAAKTSFLIGISSEQRFADSENPISRSALLDMSLSRLAQSAKSNRALTELTSRLIHLAEHFYSLRDIERLGEASRGLMNLPLRRARQIGLFYKGLALKRAGQIDDAASLFVT